MPDAFICAKVPLHILRAINNDFIQDDLKPGDVVSVCPGYDNRRRDATAVCQEMTLAALFFPYPLGSGQTVSRASGALTMAPSMPCQSQPMPFMSSYSARPALHSSSKKPARIHRLKWV
jgi:hypothetical protein